MLKNKKHQAFVDEYFFCNFNATEAYMVVYAPKGRDTARANGATLLANTSIAQEIETRFTERSMKANEVIDRLSQIARGDIAEYMDDYGAIDFQAARKAKKTHLLKKVKQRTIRKMEGTEDIEIHDLEFETYSAHEALKDLGKMHALFIDRTRNDSDALQILLRMKNENRLTELDIPSIIRDFGEKMAIDLFGEKALQDARNG